MREKLLLLASIAFLSASADHALFVRPSLAETTPAASNATVFAANLQSNSKHAVAPQRRVLVQLAQAKEQHDHATPIKRTTHYRQRVPVLTAPKPITPKPQAIHPAIDKPDIAIHHRLIADEVIKMLPETCQNSLRHFYVKSIEGRALGGKSTIIINGDPFTQNTAAQNAEFRALFIHELGHVLDLGCFTGTANSQQTVYKDGEEIMYANDPSIDFYAISWSSSHSQHTGVTDADFVSGYASWDMFEDFAESFAYYVLHQDAFRERAQQNSALAAKYRWFETYVPYTKSTAISHHDWNGTIPWDITKLQYTWANSAEYAL